MVLRILLAGVPLLGTGLLRLAALDLLQRDVQILPEIQALRGVHAAKHLGAGVGLQAADVRRLLHEARLPAAILHLHHGRRLLARHADVVAAHSIARQQLPATLLGHAHRRLVGLADLGDVLVRRLNESLVALRDWLDAFELTVARVVHLLLLAGTLRKELGLRRCLLQLVAHIAVDVLRAQVGWLLVVSFARVIMVLAGRRTEDGLRLLLEAGLETLPGAEALGVRLVVGREGHLLFLVRALQHGGRGTGATDAEVLVSVTAVYFLLVESESATLGGQLLLQRLLGFLAADEKLVVLPDGASILGGVRGPGGDAALGALAHLVVVYRLGAPLAGLGVADWSARVRFGGRLLYNNLFWL